MNRSEGLNNGYSNCSTIQDTDAYMVLSNCGATATQLKYEPSAHPGI